MIYNTQYAKDNSEKFGMTAFWKADGYLGFLAPDYPSLFSDGSHIFYTLEQYMMYTKAMMFCDYDTADKILETSDPIEAHKLGRSIKCLDSSAWRSKIVSVLVNGNCYKFNQDAELRDKLLDTDQSVIVYANPYDTEISCGTEDYGNMTSWIGSNALGFALMQTRENCRLNKIYESKHYDKY